MQTRLLEHSHNSILTREQYGFWMKLTTGNTTYKVMS